jgi:hypothetical protein
MIELIFAYSIMFFVLMVVFVIGDYVTNKIHGKDDN